MVIIHRGIGVWIGRSYVKYMGGIDRGDDYGGNTESGLRQEIILLRVARETK